MNNAMTDKVDQCELSYLMGAFFGDGCIYSNKKYYTYQFSITSSDYDLCSNVQGICRKMVNKSGTIKTVSKNGKMSYYQLVVCSKGLFTFLKEQTG